MNILTGDGKKIINYNNIAVIGMYETTNNMWRIEAGNSGGNFIALTSPYTESECQHMFNKLCDMIDKCRENDTIDMGDLWD